MLKHHNFMRVDLTKDVLVLTNISQDNHAALRAGFVGYPANPRWNINKFHAWKTGQQWREALVQGKMVVRPTDSMLVSITQIEEQSQKTSQTPKWQQMLAATKYLMPSSSQLHRSSDKNFA